MKKVLMLTFHWTNNYGGVLQAYALQQTVVKLGYDATLIDYFNDEEMSSVFSWKKRIIHSVWNTIAMNLFGRKKRSQKTDCFRTEHMNITSNRFHTIEEIIQSGLSADIYLVGSDQVWKPELTGNPSVYLLSFAKEAARRVAYAASFGVGSLSRNFFDLYSTELRKFDAISVREDTGVDIVESLIGIKPQMVLDPVFLLSREEWLEVASSKKENKEYILCYYMPTSDSSVTRRIKDLSKFYSKRLGYRIINIGKKEFEKLKFWEDNRLDSGPSDFLALVSGAKLVITNSFHGTAFAIKMNVPFIVPINYSIPKEKRLSIRIESLLRRIRCESRIVDTQKSISVEEMSMLSVMDYSQVNTDIVKLINESEEFLLNALEK